MQTLDEFSHSSPTRAGSGVSVLVVDDEAAVRRFAVRVLQRDGYDVLEAADGHEALEMLRAGQVTVDLIVSDIVMPRINGVELMQAVSRVPSWCARGSDVRLRHRGAFRARHRHSLQHSPQAVSRRATPG